MVIFKKNKIQTDSLKGLCEISPRPLILAINYQKVFIFSSNHYIILNGKTKLLGL